ncbi:hypothetical protein [Actinoplanes palleronii]|uniref:Uncharacterized protein n=1 Tax=Actinoplanes palleronii TaxID=113570 RepID=A0ABQ4BCS5_9ACTN|nr:hypothetical protein [Actinoplanes palleronii]GIE68483.1 hypothetical protein Apa02nite_045910 [Actinoplanes palleronii]
MSGKVVAAIAVVALLLSACADRAVRPGATASPMFTSCGLETSFPDSATLRAEDVWPDGGATSASYTILPADRCAGVAVRPDRCDAFPWVIESDLYPLGGRARLAVTVISEKRLSVREQVVLFAPDSPFAETYVRAAGDCGFATLTVVDGRPATLHRAGAGITEIVYLTPRSVIGMSSTDPAVGVAELVRLAGVAQERSAVLSYPS